jgi:transcriptional regulator with XRE-family HTH domain
MNQAITTILFFRTKASSKGGGGRMDARAVGQRIKAAREKKNMTQEDLAACIDISPTHVSVIERGTKIPRMDTFVAIANVLGVSADDLLVDVVDRATAGVASELSAAIEALPHEERMRVLKVVSVLVDR